MNDGISKGKDRGRKRATEAPSSKADGWGHFHIVCQ